MITIKKHGIVLEPTRKKFESRAVFNPGTYQSNGKVHMLYRALDDDYQSTFGYAIFKGPTKLIKRLPKALLSPKYKYEKKGIEDPCVVKINQTFYVTYVAHDGVNAVIAYMYGPSLTELKRGGIISPRISYSKASKLFGYTVLKDDYYLFASFYEKYGNKNILVWEKDGVLFPEKINGQFALLHRVLPDIQLAKFNDFADLKDNNYWRDHIQHLAKNVVLEGKYGFEARHIGAGAPPIKTSQGWIMIYHGVEPLNKGRIYYAGAALLDLKNPRRVIARLPYPLISPEEEYELKGEVNNVVFPTGTSLFGNSLYIYYGTSDAYVAVASMDIHDLLKELLKHKTNNPQ